jgi:hypothetical protein
VSAVFIQESKKLKVRVLLRFALIIQAFLEALA